MVDSSVLKRILKINKQAVGLAVSLLMLSALSLAEPNAPDTVPKDPEVYKSTVNALQEPLYKPFIERYVLDELKQLRVDLANQRNDFQKQINDREHNSVDRAVRYATDTVTYFFYLIAGATSVLVLAGWTSIRDMKDKVQTTADEKISKLVKQYEKRLISVEKQLNQKTLHIEENREEIELTQEIQSLWLKAGQEHNPANKIPIYDQILKVRPENGEALTYKADAILELNEPQWAASLCRQALAIDPDNSHAYYQLACAYTSMENYDEAVRNLREALSRADTYRDVIENDSALTPLKGYEPFQELLNPNDDLSA